MGSIGAMQPFIPRPVDEDQILEQFGALLMEALPHAIKRDLYTSR
jgi:hypothetical protein